MDSAKSITWNFAWLAWLACPNLAIVCQDSTPIQNSTTMGPVTATVSLSPRTPVIGDTLELRLEVTAKEDVEVLMPEFGEALGRFQISDFVPREEVGSDGETIYIQSYRLQSPASGEHAIPPILVEFVDRRKGETKAPAGMDAYELFTERIDFSVESVLVNDATAELNPPLGRLDPESLGSAPGVSPWVYLGLGFGLLGLIGLLVLTIITYRKQVNRKSAYEIARQQLDRLINQKDGTGVEDIDRFYVLLTTIVRQYLENRFELRAPELTTEEFLTTVSDSGELSSDHKKLLQDFLKHADLVKFAGLTPSQSDIDESIAKASRFLDETRENAPMLIDPESQMARNANPKVGEQDV